MGRGFNTYSLKHKFQFRKLRRTLLSFRKRSCILNIKITLNNIYLTLSDWFGQIIMVKSGGLLKLPGSGRNTNYALELLILDAIKQLTLLNTKHIVLKFDHRVLRKKKMILKLLKKFNIKIFLIRLIMCKVHNGITLAKKRRV
uniref:9d4c8d12-c8e8-46d5-8291-4e4d019c0df3-CDS n=1 Tax=Plasmodiophora brassicae TaxID=37360 RepID=A0A3P3YW74_PLABS|nr:9d4c8d12-c8e8-46d5-8291-4e4d019c0df3-CDS [Plasmodiophora brassicae]